ncbi:MAG TPA: hypothetical protein VJU79_02230 [Candidatus Dormibacteraeota bacterium]|nr:hypothetical protein [Candidatus Dormibacteraeota bacterium]
MSRLRIARLAVAGCTVAALTGTAGVLPAAAVSYSTDTVAFVANMQLDPPWQLVGGAGVFALQSTVCEQATVSGKPVPGAGLGPCAMVANGNYISVVCGNATLAGVMDVGGDALNFNAEVVAGSVGVLTGMVTSGPDAGDTVAGAFDVASNNPPPLGTCAISLTLLGALSL